MRLELGFNDPFEVPENVRVLMEKYGQSIRSESPIDQVQKMSVNINIKDILSSVRRGVGKCLVKTAEVISKLYGSQWG